MLAYLHMHHYSAYSETRATGIVDKVLFVVEVDKTGRKKL